MKKYLTITSLVLFFFLTGTFRSMAQPLDEHEKEGLSHFNKAFYEATPRKDKAKATAEYQKAEKAFQKAIEKNPQRVESYLHLGRTYFVQKKYQKAATIYRKALKLAPEHKETYLQLASALEMGGDGAGAVDVLKELREKETDERSIQILDDLIERLESKY
jgi:cytochrome c-type biogenesis protein CcmH/NrfG